MNETSTQRTPTPAGGATVVRRGLATIAGWNAGLIALYGVLLLVSPDEKPPGSGCDGIGFGCTPDPRTSLLLVGFIVGIPFLIGSLIATFITFGVIVRKHQSGFKAGMISVAVGSIIAIAVPLIASLFL